MQCDACAARTAAGPAMPPGPPVQDKAAPGASDTNSRLDAVEARLAALEDAVMQSQMASLDASVPRIDQYVRS